MHTYVRIINIIIISIINTIITMIIHSRTSCNPNDVCLYVYAYPRAVFLKLMTHGTATSHAFCVSHARAHCVAERCETIYIYIYMCISLYLSLSISLSLSIYIYIYIAQHERYTHACLHTRARVREC